MVNTGYLSWLITPDQRDYAKKLALFSLQDQDHPVGDVFRHDAPDNSGLEGDERSYYYRYKGVLAEIIIADAYGYPRPKRAYGKNGGQDCGWDFTLCVPSGEMFRVDIKSMARNCRYLKASYVANIPVYQATKDNTLTEYYMIVSYQYSRMLNDFERANLMGIIKWSDLFKYGEFFPEGTLRLNERGQLVRFNRDTYEVMLGLLSAPYIPKNASMLPGFEMRTIIEDDVYEQRLQEIKIKNNVV